MLPVFIFLSCGYIPSEEDERPFIKQYNLLKLDSESCSDCAIDVQENHIYKILKNGKEVGEGEWHLKHPIDFPGFVIELENGPSWMIYENDTVIDYINRRNLNK
jgi:hypothetical protein